VRVCSPTKAPFTAALTVPTAKSERKALYRQYAEQLVKDGKAYYAFDTPEELDVMRQAYKTPANPPPQYDQGPFAAGCAIRCRFPLLKHSNCLDAGNAAW